jgi:hypothetical protein
MTARAPGECTSVGKPAEEKKHRSASSVATMVSTKKTGARKGQNGANREYQERRTSD